MRNGRAGSRASLASAARLQHMPKPLVLHNQPLASGARTARSSAVILLRVAAIGMAGAGVRAVSGRFLEAVRSIARPFIATAGVELALH
jgi:hypothetical protein